MSINKFKIYHKISYVVFSNGWRWDQLVPTKKNREVNTVNRLHKISFLSILRPSY